MGRFCVLLLATAVCVLSVSSVVLVDGAAKCSLDTINLAALQAGGDLKGSDGTVPSPGTTSYDYYMAVCRPLNTQPACTTMGPSANCQVSQDTPPVSRNIGSWPAGPAPVPTMTYLDPNNKLTGGVGYTLTGDTACYVGASKVAYTSIVQFPCAKTAGPLTVKAPSGCTETYIYPTPLACVGSAPDPDPTPDNPDNKGSASASLSGGWIFIIILVVIIPLYIGVGCIYKSQKLGSTGMDKCPNVEFWRDCPGLIKDGFSFTFSKIRSCCGGSNAGGGSSSGGNGSYETM